MLFWLFVIVMAIGIVLLAIGRKCWDSDKHPFLWEHDSEICSAGGMIFMFSGFAVIIMTVILCYTYTNVGAKVEVNKERYAALEYKIESGACRDELGLLSKEVIDEVQEWNEDVVYYRNTQNNFWIGIFYPDVYDQFETIDYEKWH